MPDAAMLPTVPSAMFLIDRRDSLMISTFGRGEDNWHFDSGYVALGHGLVVAGQWKQGKLNLSDYG